MHLRDLGLAIVLYAVQECGCDAEGKAESRRKVPQSPGLQLVPGQIRPLISRCGAECVRDSPIVVTYAQNSTDFSRR
jgi:hypothetical protein